MYVNFSALTCSLPVKISNGLLDSTDNVIGSAVTYMCLIGHRFPDGTNQRTTICLRSQLWSVNIENCQRTSLVYTNNILALSTYYVTVDQ